MARKGDPMRSPGRCFLLLLFVSGFVLFSPKHAYAQVPAADTIDAPDDDAPANDTPNSFLSVTVTVEPAGKTTAVATFYLADGTKLPPAEIKYALQSALGCTLEDSLRSRPAPGLYSGSCLASSSARGLLREGRISTAPLTAFAARYAISNQSIELHLPDLEVLETFPPVQRTATPNSRAYAYVDRYLRTLFAFTASPSTPFPAEIIFRYGYSASSLRRYAVILALVLLVPIVLFGWLSRKALSADTADKAVVWFSYIRSLNWILNGTLLAWWIALDDFHVDQILRLLASATRFEPFAVHPFFLEAASWIPPALIWLLCCRISHPVQQQLRGLRWTKRELTLQAVYSILARLFPLAMFLTGLRVIATDGFRTALLWWAAAFVLRIVAAQALLRHTGMLPQALSSGDLRDRAFAMAERVGVKLQQVYLIPSGKGQIANAFARTGNTISFTDFLLKRLSQREADYVLAHELSHLRLKHPAKLGYAFLGGIFLGILASGYAAAYFHDSVAARYVLIFLIISLFPYVFSRRFEYAADAGAVAATHDPRAAISALFKISELNMMPIHWSHWREKWLTHPSSLRRARAIARKAGIPFEEIPVIAREGAAETQSYAIPATGGPVGKVHSSQQTRSLALKLSLILIALLAFLPSLISLVAVHVPSLAKWVVFASAIPLTFCAFLIFVNYSPRFVRSTMASSLSHKLAAEGIQTKSWNGIFVSLSPAAVPRFYDGSANWDIGYLFFYSDRICYWGEEAKFALRPQQITAIKLAEGMPGLLPTKRIYIAWKDEERGTCGVFNLARGRSSSILQGNRQTLELTQRLQAWWKTPPISRPLPPQIAALTPPQIRTVTSQNPAERWKPRRLFNELLWSSVFAGVGAALCGLPFHLTSFLLLGHYASAYAHPGIANHAATPGAGWYVVAVAFLVRLVTLIPHLRYRDVPKLIAAPPGKPASNASPSVSYSSAVRDKVPTA